MTQTPVMQHPYSGVPTAHDIASAQRSLQRLVVQASDMIAFKSPVEHLSADKQPATAEVREMMEDHGWHMVGAGNFSVVYVRGGLAIKLGFKQEDSGAAYAAWARANQGQPGVPVIHGVARWDYSYAVLMDEYTKYIPYRDFHMDAEFEAAQHAINGNTPICDFETTDTARQIGRFFRGLARIDLHRDNVMVDRYNRLVITDPVSYSKCGAVLDNVVKSRLPKQLPVIGQYRGMPDMDYQY